MVQAEGSAVECEMRARFVKLPADDVVLDFVQRIFFSADLGEADVPRGGRERGENEPAETHQR